MVRAASMVTFCVALAGCSDLGTAPAASPAPAGGARTYSSTDVDPAKSWPVQIRSHLSGVEMPTGSSYPAQATVRASMFYDAYHARITAKGILRDASGTTTRDFLPKEQHTTFYFQNNHLPAEWSIALTKSCGSILEADVSYEAWWRGFAVGSGEIVLERAVAADQAIGQQEECECEEGGGNPGTELMPHIMGDVAYDPYAPSDLSTDCGGGSGGGGGGGGTQYEPGDSTGGETVDWGTGQGNGGESACGDQAIVEYICVDIWIEGSGWREWSCGFATTC